MSAKIMQQLSQHFIRQMRNWAMANAGTLDGSVISSIYRGEGSGDGYGSSVPIIQGEAIDTDFSLKQIPVRYRSEVMLFWQYEGRPLTWLARRCAVDFRTYEKRVAQGHEMLIAELAKQSEKMRNVRAGFESLQRATA